MYFWSSQYPNSKRFKYYSPPLRSKDFKQSVGDFVMSVFVPGSLQALTATMDGDVVVWDEQGITAQMGTRATDRRASKLMRIHQQVRVRMRSGVCVCKFMCVWACVHALVCMPMREICVCLGALLHACASRGMHCIGVPAQVTAFFKEQHGL